MRIFWWTPRAVAMYLSEGLVTISRAGIPAMDRCAGGVPPYRGDEERIRRACGRMGFSSTTGELGACIASELASFSMFDLQLVMGRLRWEVERLPFEYREAIRPYLLGRAIALHHEVLTRYYAGDFAVLDEPIRDMEAFSGFCRMVPPGCLDRDASGEYLPQHFSPVHRLFFYLLSGYAMYVLGEPGHPVGMPFPGGLLVEERAGAYYCPVRDKEKDVFFSICNYCPAKQS